MEAERLVTCGLHVHEDHGEAFGQALWVDRFLYIKAVMFGMEKCSMWCALSSVNDQPSKLEVDAVCSMLCDIGY